MASKNDLQSLNGLFKELYSKSLKSMVPSGVRLMTWTTYETMPMEELEYHAAYSKKAADVFKRRNSKLGRYLEGAGE